MAIVCDGYPGVQISRGNFVGIQRAIGGLVGELPEEEFAHRLTDTYWTKEPTIIVCQDEETRDGLATWEGSRLKMVGLDALPTYKKVVA